MRIVILNQYCENRGDEAAGEALVRCLINRPDIQKIDIIYNSAYALNIEDKKVVHHNEDLRLKYVGIRGIAQYLILRRTPLFRCCYANNVIKKMAEIISLADLIYVAPCGASIGIYKDWCFLLRIVFAVYEGKMPVFYLNTIGKSGNVLFDSISRWVLKRSKIYVREKKSQYYISKIGLSAQCGIDAAFMLPRCIKNRKSNTLGIVLTQLFWHPSFKGRDMDKEIKRFLIPQIVSFCNITGYDVELIPHLAKEEEFNFYQDIKKLLEQGIKSETRVKIRSDILTASAYDKAISQCHLILGMRYHTIVLSAKNLVPFLALSYENKMLEVCNYTACQDYCIDLQKENPEYFKVCNKLLDLCENSQKIEEHLNQIIDKDFLKLAKLPLKELPT